MNTRHSFRPIQILDTDVICECKTSTLGIDSNISFHNHDGYEIFLFLDGKADYFTEQQGLSLRRGDLILTPPYLFHCSQLSKPQPYKRAVLNIRTAYLLELCTAKSNLLRCFDSKDKMPNLLCLNENETQNLEKKFLELQMLLTSHQWGDDILAKACLCELLVMINRYTLHSNVQESERNLPHFLSDVLSYIDTHLSEELSLQILSEFVNLNKDYLNRRFKQLTGTTINQYIIAKRTTLAQKYLREGHSPEESCYLSGFQNYSHFSRTFLKQTGSSPRQYQQKFLAESIQVR